MKKLSLFVGVMALAGLATGAAAEDEATSPHVFSANVAMKTDYMFRGISQTDDGPAIQGGFDYSYEPRGFYAGSWASNVELLPFGSAVKDRSSIEVDFYGGFAGELNGIGWDFGGLYYYYPAQHEDSGPAGNYDFGEFYGSLSYSFGGSLGFTLPMVFGLSGTVGYLDVEGDKTTGAIGGYDYVHYVIGVSKEMGIFTFDVSWNDSDHGCSDLYGGDDDLCEGVVFSVSSSW